VETADQGQEVELALDTTPFYGEMGGQVGDTGKIRGANGEMMVANTFRPSPEMIVHCGRVVEGSLSIGDEVEAEVDIPRRLDIARNHTATHLLQAALRAVLGTEVHQSGSLVAPERLRFDFTQLTATSREQVTEIQRMVNERIRQNLPVTDREMSYSEAADKGAIALFGEKYGEVVRAVAVSDPAVSLELCGGTHVRSTGEIGLFQIVSEGSIGAGVHRIEAVTGRGAEQFLEEFRNSLETIAQQLQTSPAQAQDKVSALLDEMDGERKRATALEQELARKMADSLLSRVESIDGVNFLAARVSTLSPGALRTIGDRLKEQLQSGVFVLGTVHDSRPSFVVMVTPDLVSRGFHAGAMVKEIAKVTGGGGGGKAELGQGSGKDKKKPEEALERARVLSQSRSRG